LKQHGKMTVWLANIDSSKSRRQGRRLPKSLCLEMPKLAEVEDTARTLGLESTSKSDAARPSRPWEKTGYIIVERKGKTRSFVLKSLAQAMHMSRQTKPKGKPG
jgi:signal recognition particle subunit SRP19